jgi:hypothetical protein
MELPLITFDWSATPSTFVSSWSKLYNYPMEPLYTQNIHKSFLSHTDIAQLYEWKNGSRLSQKKQAAFDAKIGARLHRINDLKQELHVNQFQKEFADISAIWKIFLIHIIAPDIYPIFDQHVFRAYSYLTTQELKEIPLSNNHKEKIYFQGYLAFFNGIVATSQQPRKQVDEALFSFGRFLKTIYGRSIHGVEINLSDETDEFD